MRAIPDLRSGSSRAGAEEELWPDRLEIEASGAKAILSWEMPPPGYTAQIFRRQGSKAGSFQKIGETQEDHWTVDIPASDATAAYKIRLLDLRGEWSASSNVVVLPNACPPLTCEGILERLWDRRLRDRYVSGEIMPGIRATLEKMNLQQATDEPIDASVEELSGWQEKVNAMPSVSAAPDELEVLLYKFLRRCRLAQSGLIPVSALFRSAEEPRPSSTWR